MDTTPRKWRKYSKANAIVITLALCLFCFLAVSAQAQDSCGVTKFLGPPHGTIFYYGDEIGVVTSSKFFKKNEHEYTVRVSYYTDVLGLTPQGKPRLVKKIYQRRARGCKIYLLRPGIYSNLILDMSGKPWKRAISTEQGNPWKQCEIVTRYKNELFGKEREMIDVTCYYPEGNDFHYTFAEGIGIYEQKEGLRLLKMEIPTDQ